MKGSYLLLFGPSSQKERRAVVRLMTFRFVSIEKELEKGIESARHATNVPYSNDKLPHAWFDSDTQLSRLVSLLEFTVTIARNEW
jgi:hypothetical protein